MQSFFSYNIDQYYHYKNWPIYVTLDKANNFQDFKIKEYKFKAQKPKLVNNFFANIEIFEKAQKKTK